MAGIDTSKQNSIEKTKAPEKASVTDKLHSSPKDAYLEHAKLVKEMKPQLPSPAEAFKSLLADAKSKWGADNVKNANLADGDVDTAITVAVLGPGTYNAMGHDQAAVFGKAVREYAQPLLKN